MLKHHAPSSSAEETQARKPLRQRSAWIHPKIEMANLGDKKPIKISLFDRWLLMAVIAIMLIGLMMVYSASIAISQKMFHQPFYFVTKQLIQLVVGLGLAFFVLKMNMLWWEKNSQVLLILVMLLLVLVLVPGIGRQINGSMRWLGFAGIGFQVSECAKLAVILFLARYLVQHQSAVNEKFSGFLKPMLVLGIICILLLKEPDFGSATVILVTALGMLFLAGARLWQFAVLLATVVAALIVLAVSSPYRMARLTGFLNPWANPFDSGYQLTQSLIAFGRGSLFGVGLGDSVQKLFYLPEAHTDFLFSVLAEELGLIGCLVVIALFGMIVYRILTIGRQAVLNRRRFEGYTAYGIALWVAMQVTVNIGVSSGLLPTKGLTLPLMSYGGSSLLMMCIAFALVFRIDYENRLAQFGLRQRNPGQTILKSK